MTTPQWVNDQQVLFKTIDTHRGLGDQKFGPGLFVVNNDGVALTMLITGGDAPSTTGTNIHSQLPLSVEHALLFVPPAGGTDIVVGKWVFDQQGNTVGINALRVNVVTHRVMSMSQDRPEHAMQWLFDPHGEPRAIVATNAGRSTVWWHAPGKTDWTSVAEFPMLRTAFTPVYVDGSAQLYVTAPTGERGTDVLTRFDFAKGRAEPQPIVATPGFDVGGGIVTDDSGARMVGMRIDTDAAATIWFDQDMKDFQALVDAKFPGRVNVVTCRKCNSTGAALVYSYSDQEPGTWLAYRAADKTWQQLGRVHDDIDPRRMAQLDFHRIAARDGEDLPVWVTTPRRAKDAPRPPAIVLVHGGPWVRGTSWEWNAEAQFLASRGYVVIEPEYRGSEGFGSLHQHAGDKQCGGKMQDDVADAARWAATKGLVDPKRICIAGASYGGYAALMGPIRYPDLYRCAVAWVAVTDPRFMYEETWTNDSNVEWQHFGLPDTVGDLDKDRAMLAAAAPVETRLDTPPRPGAAGVRGRRPARADQARHRDARRDARGRQRPRMDRLSGRRPRLAAGRDEPRLLEPRRSLPGQERPIVAAATGETPNARIRLSSPRATRLARIAALALAFGAAAGTHAAPVDASAAPASAAITTTIRTTSAPAECARERARCRDRAVPERDPGRQLREARGEQGRCRSARPTRARRAATASANT